MINPGRCPGETLTTFRRRLEMKIKVIHQWRDWLLECGGVGQYSFIKKDNKVVVHTFVAKNHIDAENQCQRIINAAKKLSKIERVGDHINR
jgi:hypothetical protein